MTRSRSILGLVALACALARADVMFETAIVIDAGSTGSRSFLYTVARDASGGLAVTRAKGIKVKPGLSAFADAPEDAAPYLMPLFEHAARVIDAEKHGATRVFVKATAGMRLLAPSAQDAIFDALAAGLGALAPAAFPFALRRADVGTITGTAEGYYCLLYTSPSPRD